MSGPLAIAVRAKPRGTSNSANNGALTTRGVAARYTVGTTVLAILLVLALLANGRAVPALERRP